MGVFSMKTKFFFILFIVFVFFLNGQTFSQTDDNPWQMFLHDSRHTGLSDFNGPENPELKWKYQPLFSIASSPCVNSSGMVYFGTKDDYLYAINPDGTVRWRYLTGGDVDSSPAIGLLGTIYFGSDDGFLYALNPDGTLIFRYDAGGAINSSPVISGNGTIYIGSDNNKLVAINPDGSQKWEIDTRGAVCSSPAIEINGNIYFGSHDGFLYAVHSDGLILWQINLGSRINSSPSIDDSGVIYIGSEDNLLYVINPDGTEKWRFETSGPIYSSPAIGSEGTIYIGSDDTYLYAVDNEGIEKWKFKTEAIIRSSPAIDKNGTIYIASLDDYIYAVNPDGTEKWRALLRYELNTFNTIKENRIHDFKNRVVAQRRIIEDDSNLLFCSSPAIGKDETLYIGSLTGLFFAIRGEYAEPTPTDVDTITPTNTLTPTITVSKTPTMTDEETATPTEEATITETPLPSMTLTPIATITKTITNIHTITQTPIETKTPEPEKTITGTETAIPTVTSTNGPQETETPVETPTITPEETSTPIPTSNETPYDSGEFQINSYTKFNQCMPSVAKDSSGNFVVVWESWGQDGSFYGIYGQRFNASIEKVGNDFRINSKKTFDQMRPVVAMDSKGNFVVAWQSWGQDGFSFGIYAQRYNKDGSKLGNEFRVNSKKKYDQIKPSIAMDGSGNFVVTWQSWKQDSSWFGIYAQNYNSNGEKIGDEFRVNSQNNWNQSNPDVSINDNGDYVIAWQSFDQDESWYGILAQRFDNAGNKVGDEFLVNTTTNCSQDHPSVEINNDGDFVIVWQSLKQDDSWYGIFGQQYDSVGIPVGEEFNINTTTEHTQGRPDVSLNDDGSFIAAWHSFKQDESWFGIMAQRFDTEGNKVAEEFQVNSESKYSQDFPSIVVDDSGDFVVTWQSWKQDGSWYGIFGKKFFE